MTSSDSLSPNDKRLLKLILAGKSNAQIARDLNWPNGAHVRNSISRLYSKLGLSGPREMLPRVEELKRFCDNVTP